MNYPGSYDVWKRSPPDEPGPDPVDPHEQCEDALEHAEDEIGQLHRQVEELEIELAALRGKASERMTYGELFSAVSAIMPESSISISVHTARYAFDGKLGAPKTRWHISAWLRETVPSEDPIGVNGDTAEEALAAFKQALVNVPVPEGDLTGVDKLVGDADVGF
jgi:hypothetical protein